MNRWWHMLIRKVSWPMQSFAACCEGPRQSLREWIFQVSTVANVERCLLQKSNILTGTTRPSVTRHRVIMVHLPPGDRTTPAFQHTILAV